ncbi:MAG: amino acid adenylation domain-containing protein [Pedosphaera sp.]|nr:amino acid adenylation domain-containing protein [Pedosphaera sp.]
MSHANPISSGIGSDRPHSGLFPAPPSRLSRMKDGAKCLLLHEFFRRSARRWPDRVAVDVPPGTGRPERSVTTYAELDRSSDALASILRPFIAGECVVAILLPRNSCGLYAAQLAVLKAGAAYTCLDPSFPEERVRVILADAKPVVLFTDGDGAHIAQAAGMESSRVVCVADIPIHDEPSSSSSQSPTPENGERVVELTSGRLAYIIYTSGTTGRPKGVMIEHGSIANLVASDLVEFQLTCEDRVAQGSSAAYDSSVEEIWLAFASGAAVVVMDEETSRLGPDLIPWLQRERITVFCPPPTLLRATGCENPETALPKLRRLYVGGEALPRDVADCWAPGRELTNGYGPTECTVTCLRGPIVAHGLISIGRPISGVEAWVLDESLNDVASGGIGELCIGGVGLARGYLGRPELTAEKFIDHPRLGRLYRTGDLARCDADGQFVHLGRMDAQVKVRGYRIELEEIESRLAKCPGVRAAACCVQEHAGNPLLVAFVVPEDSTNPPQGESLKSALRAQLPAYMIPTRVGILDELPRSVGGKLNRAALPPIGGNDSARNGQRIEPRNALEARIAASFAKILRPMGGVSIEDDFFNDLSGDSLSAAELVSLLRNDPSTAWIGARDLYEARSVAGLAARAPRVAQAAATQAAAAQGPSVRVVLIQSLWMLKTLVIGSAAAYIGAFYILPMLTAALGWLTLLLLAPPLGLAAAAAYALLTLGWAVFLKGQLIGRYQPLRAPIWGDFYLRNWIVQRAVGQVPWWLIDGTEFKNMALRALGATIGRRVHIHRGVDLLRGGWDLLEIGDDVTVDQEAVLSLVEFVNQEIVVARVSLGTGSTLDVHAFVSGGATVEENGWLAARSWLAPGSTLGRGERWDGIPARRTGFAPQPPAVPDTSRHGSPLATSVGMILAQMTLLAVLAMPTELLSIGAALLTGTASEDIGAWFFQPTLDLRILLASVGILTLSVPGTLVLEAFTCRALGRVRPGVISRWSLGFIRIWLKTGMLDSGSQWLYGTLFWPHWLRLAGMKVGKRCEISSLYNTLPENVEIGDDTFCADGIYLGGARLHRGTVTVAPLRVGKNSFFGNGAILAGGLTLPDDVLLGVCTVAEGVDIRPGTSWFGHPPFELPRRQIIRMDPRLTHNPSPVRYGVRVFWELLRFVLPVILATILPLWYFGLARAERAFSFPILLFVAVPVLSLTTTAFTAIVIVAIKWALLGRVRPGVHPLWSSWASRWDFVCLAWNLYMKLIVGTLDGTLGLAVLLRTVGVRIGRGVVLGTGFAEDIPDPDMLCFEDGATVDGLFQAHTFEDHVLKMDYITVRQGATLGRNAVLLYGSDIGAGAQVAPNSVVMKNEHLLPSLFYEGAPTRAR